MDDSNPPVWAAWRPQRFGHSDVRKVSDPLIEPLWIGERVLVEVETAGSRAVDGPYVAILDEAGDPIDDFPGVQAGVAAATRATSLLIDGYLTDQVERGVEHSTVPAVTMPKFGDLTRQVLMGGGRRREEYLPEDRNLPANPAVPTTLVAVDLLMVDDESLLEVPLLERKRVLESVLDENQFVRRGIYVRPPLDPWLVSWRSIGFHSIAFKAANSRYRPGLDNSGWAIARIPSR
ncbi:MAG TPA: hypothetical protein VKR24_07860 [Candidatus Limnocylindrales bacterium]|nr:hypothetical protein [Candidatus Limnocylindrales bacterium]